MTFNLRIRVEADGINCFDNRRPRIIETIRTEAPDLIGFQEGNDLMMDFLREELSDTYTIIGCGRNTDYSGESASVAFRRDLFRLISCETLWLSNAPSTPGTSYEGSDQSRCPRVVTHVTLIAKGTSTPFHFFNTHLDHIGEVARQLGMTQILQSISLSSGAVILTGDMNARPDSLPVKMALDFAGGRLTDATADVPVTFHGWGSRAIKIDYIFTDLPVLSSYHVPDEPKEGEPYISDHYPVVAELSL